MKSKKLLIGVFENMTDAKNALGRIKKATWNRADLALIVPQKSHRGMSGDVDLELASESFLDLPHQGHLPLQSGLRPQTISGVGEVLIGQGRNNGLVPQGLNLSQPEFERIQQSLQEHRLLAVIKADPGVLPKLRLILETSGANIL